MRGHVSVCSWVDVTVSLRVIACVDIGVSVGVSVDVWVLSMLQIGTVLDRTAAKTALERLQGVSLHVQ